MLAVPRLPTVAASLVVENGFLSRFPLVAAGGLPFTVGSRLLSEGLHLLQSTGSRLTGSSSCCTWAQ